MLALLVNVFEQRNRLNGIFFKILVMKKIHFTFSFPSLRVRSKMEKMKVVILGGGEGGVGAAILAKTKGLEVFLSDKGEIKENYKKVLAIVCLITLKIR